MVLRVGSDFGEPRAGHHDASGSNRILAESVQAGSVHGMGHGKIVSMNDKKFRISSVAQTFGYSFVLRAHAARSTYQEQGSGRNPLKVHGNLQNANLAVQRNTAMEESKVQHGLAAEFYIPGLSVLPPELPGQSSRDFEQFFAVAVLIVYIRNLGPGGDRR